MNVLVIGSGGREHALCWALARSPRLERLFCAPGNGGIAGVAECRDLDPLDFAAVESFCREADIGLVVVGPEAPLVAGIVDHLRGAGIRAFGPERAAAALEGSKGFMKDLCARHGIPTAAYGRFREAAAAKAFAAELGAPVVVKTDGLAAGKGVTVAATLAEADAAIDAMLGGRFGAAGEEVVVEEFMVGEEASFFAIVGDDAVLPLATAQDHKAVGDGDTGPNTGGMGAYSPAPVMTDALVEQVMAEIVRPTVAGMQAEGMPYRGILYAGLMITATGPRLVEYNIRFGDPECQVLLPRLKSDLLDVLIAACDGRLGQVALDWSDEAALVVVLAAEGYPGDYRKGTRIGRLDRAAALDGVLVFHAGTARRGDALVATGGRVLGITATGPTVGAARDRAYAAVDRVDWPEGFCRRDIGWRAIERETAS
ncbi:phosphoribosylamine--glycine ligase [Oceanibacterium hippocampi]|uniref:Phosphoribosylamine--glycine ligase n=1 Tax=Oceanibacterium hippocampi TaxID=745714 RepID=A0A1Y5S5I6_9PROT|nr:phosphoribosylamine--glycine ligase [Oceanibacterium hippocampi]SLN33033.1 Phosphoribosylamine--glycine ligase [Oceanibacterium hippocampi]